MRSKKQWIITAAAAVLLAAGGTTAFVASEAAPMTHEENLNRTQEKFGKAPAMPTGGATQNVPDQTPTVPGPTPTMPTRELSKEQTGQSTAESDWMNAELLKQQATFAQHAPSPMPTGHDSTVVAGNKP